MGSLPTVLQARHSAAPEVRHVAAAPGFRLTAGRYVVCAKADDPIVRPARARLIWAANTAQATHDLGVRTMLVGGIDGLNFKTDVLMGQFAAQRQLNHIYGVDADFDIQLVYGHGPDKDRLKWIVHQEYPRYVLPYAGLVHTRDPEIALQCAKRKINYVWEHHGEEYQHAFDNYHGLELNNPHCRAIVAITSEIRAHLLASGVPAGKVIVLDSGVSESAAEPRRKAAEQWRRFFLTGGYRSIVCYAGGMQRERGIDQILDAAERLPDVRFVLLGGHERDIELWRPLIADRRLVNVKLPGYQPHAVVCEIQQASDALVMTRAADGRPGVTSPLKFFEYLLAGRPVVAARVEALEPFRRQNLDVEWYEPGEPDAFMRALQTRLASSASWETRSERNIEAGLCHTWRNRQARLLDFIGPVEAKTTF